MAVNILAQRIHYHRGLEASFPESRRSENTNPCHLLTQRVNHRGFSKVAWWSRLLCRGWQALERQLWRLKFPFLSGRIYVGSLGGRRQTEQIDCTCHSTVRMRWTSPDVIFNSTKHEKLKTTKLHLCWEKEGTRTVRSSRYYEFCRRLLMLWVPWLITFYSLTE